MLEVVSGTVVLLLILPTILLCLLGLWEVIKAVTKNQRSGEPSCVSL
jgi:hypothetical protein